MTELEQKIAAKEFVNDWKNKGYEKGESQSFWRALLCNVFGVEKPELFVEFEKPVKNEKTGTIHFIDCYIPATKVLIEQKSADIDLLKGYRQSNGEIYTPYEQAKQYANDLLQREYPRYIITCNFRKIYIYDMNNRNGESECILLEDLPEEYHRLKFLIDAGNDNIRKEMDISIKAGDIVGLLYDEILKQYENPESEETLKSLNMLCVRLVFCLYAEDSGLFGEHLKFHDYIKSVADKDIEDVSEALAKLFKVLDTKPEDRSPYLKQSLASFPYVNGGLFANENIEIPQFNEKIVSLLLNNASAEFNWSEISPTIFGAVFESTLNPETRRSGGMHYTSIENIHKVIDPLFLNDLRAELDEIKKERVTKTLEKKLHDFQNKLASFKFLDPACGSGNFLTETYISLRRLENEVIYLLNHGQVILAEMNPIKVSIGQFYGIEINDFAVTVAKTALWIAESQMMQETEEIVHITLDFLPLKSYANIEEANALTIDWESVAPKGQLSFIMGNPPFVGARLMQPEQKNDLNAVFGKWKNAGNLDYVSCWFKKAVEFIKGTSIRAALVATNSVSQGEQVAILWKPLFEMGVHIDFAHRTFQWDSEANIKAHVHCVIIGFSIAPNPKDKVIYTDDRPQIAKNINPYLVDAESIFIESRSTPICDVPNIGIGNKPIDGGFYLFKKDEMEEFIKLEPASAKWFRPWIGSDEFINRYYRYCLWLGECPPNELRAMPECLKRVQAVREYRLASPSEGTVKLADRPTRFHVENICDTTYLLIPRVSSEKRKYIPIGFIESNVLSSDSVHIIPNATLYHFGVLTSNVHMAWTRAVCGRLEMRYRYSKEVVYNNFPWCTPTDEQKAEIERTAQGILDARALYHESSLADLYGEHMYLYPELRKAHIENDKAVMKAYGFPIKMLPSECVAELMKMYQKLSSK